MGSSKGSHLARRRADGVSDLVSAVAVHGGLAIGLFRSVLRWAIAAVSARAEKAATEEKWASVASDFRLLTPALRALAWTAVLEDKPDPVVPAAAARAASLIAAALAFREELGSADCPERLREHCERLFSTTLVPGPERFAVHRGKGRHVLLGVEGTLWALDVLDEGGTARPQADILEDLRTCLAAPKVEAPPVLALTSRLRSEAAAHWTDVERANPEAATLLMDALFAVFLDPASPPDVDAAGRLAQGGPAHHRSFWHALQLVVFKNGKAAVVGSFVAGVEGEGSLELSLRLGRAEPVTAARATTGGAAPRRLAWDLGAGLAKKLGAAPAGPVDAGGTLRAPGFGTRAWKQAGVSPESAMVLALRMALDAVVPDLDELECMVNLGHVHHGVVTRLGTNTGEMRAFLRAAAGDGDLGAPCAAALAAHGARVRQAKQLESAEVALEFAFFALRPLSALARAALGFVTRWLALLITWRTPPGERANLARPKIAVNSSVPHRPGVAAVGRFGVLAPSRSIWIHHSFSEEEVGVVVQLGPDTIDRAGELRRAIPVALARVHGALRDRSGPRSAERAALPAPLAVPNRLAYRRLLGLLAALGDRTASRSPRAGTRAQS